MVYLIMLAFSYVLSFSGSFACLLFLTYYFKNRVSVYYSLLFSAILLINFGYMQMSCASDIDAAVYSNQTIYLGSSFVLFFLFMCLADLCKIKIPFWVQIFYIVFGAIIFTFASTIGASTLYYKNIWIVKSNDAYFLAKEYGPFHFVYILELISTTIIGYTLIIKSFFHKKDVSYFHSSLLMVFTTLIVGVYIFEMLFPFDFPLLPFVYVFCEIGLLIILSRICLYDISSTSADFMSESKSNGFIICNSKGIFLGSDANAKRFFPDIGNLMIDYPIPNNQNDLFIQISKWVKNEEVEDSAFISNGDCIYEVKHSVLQTLLRRKVHCFYLRDDTMQQTYTKLIESYNENLENSINRKSEELAKIQNAFSQCLSPDVVADIVAHPSRLRLGGVRREMSAIFTDIQGFSSFSELLDAGELVELLNLYLTEMSDIIMGERGTIDKYEGDAIIAFMGAPLEMSDHARSACLAAVKMKKAERILNKQIFDISNKSKRDDMNPVLYNAFSKLASNGKKIYTRIGINSGEMIAGFMGSEKKKNYTIMGNDVNLASRLEGVNKHYSTGGILISEATREKLGNEFLVRSLDRVQVVNVKTPIRLYELLGVKTDFDSAFIKYISYWEIAMSTFEKGDYSKALGMYKKLFEMRPSDSVAKYYMQMLKKFFCNGTYPTKEDDFGVVYNFDNPSDINPRWIGTKYEIKGSFSLLHK